MITKFLLQLTEKVSTCDYAGCRFFDNEYIELRHDYYNYVSLVTKYGELSVADDMLCKSIDSLIQHLDYMCELEPFVMGEPHQYKEGHIDYEEFVEQCENSELDFEANLEDELVDLLLDVDDFAMEGIGA